MVTHYYNFNRAGALVGLVVSSVLFGIISSSVNAVIVCFASSPVSCCANCFTGIVDLFRISHVYLIKVDFHANHPDLSAEMRSAWREVWPGCMDVVDIRMAVASYLDSASIGGGEQQPLLS